MATSQLFSASDKAHAHPHSTPPTPTVKSGASGATTTVYDLGAIKIHSFTTPWEVLGNTTTVIEGATQLVVVDAQLLVPYAQEFRAYIDSLGKPIERLLLTHAHPDHWLGLAAAFTDIENTFALAAVKRDIETNGPGRLAVVQKELGEMAPKEFVGVKQVFEPGVITVEDIEIEIVEYRDAEIDVQAVFKLPEFGVILTGDLVYAYGHYFLTTNFDNWVSILNELQGESSYSLVVPGHGLPSMAEVYTDGINYLETSKAAFAEATGAEDLRARLLEAYPDRPGTRLMDIYLPRFYPAA